MPTHLRLLRDAPPHEHESPRAAASEAAFRDAMRHLPGGVFVITTGVGEERTGFTATSVASLSVQPATMMVSVNRASSSYPILARSGVFGVNVLAREHIEIAVHFAERAGARGADRYRSGRWVTLASGVWLLSDALVAMDCAVEEIIERHTHAIVIGRVKDIAVSDGAGALVYWRGGFDQLGWSQEELSRAVGLTPTP